MQTRSNIALIGFWATGKTTVGKKLAKKLKMNFIDIDKVIEEKSKMSIFEIFDKLGGEKFRNMEVEEMNKTQDIKNTVIACGAGVVLVDSSMKTLKENSIIIWLDLNAKEIIERIKKGKNFRILKPKELNLEKINGFLRIRVPLYEKYCDLKIDTHQRTVDEVVKKIQRFNLQVIR